MLGKLRNDDAKGNEDMTNLYIYLTNKKNDFRSLDVVRKSTINWSPSQPFLGMSRNAPSKGTGGCCVTSQKTAPQETTYWY